MEKIVPIIGKSYGHIYRLRQASRWDRGVGARIGLAILFLVAAGLFASFQTGLNVTGMVVIVASVIGGYMALNIGANDVANNVGPAVGSKALTLVGALVVAAVFEPAGAVLAGGDVVATISKGIIDPAPVGEAAVFITLMMAALLAAALWLNVATYVGAPVSTTHSIVGGVMGAGIAATGFASVNWPTMAKIAASWVISPVMGGVIAALLLSGIKVLIHDKEDTIAAAKKWLPVVVAVMASVFFGYLAMKGLKKIWRPGALTVAVLSVATFAATYFLSRPAFAKRAAGLENRRKAVNILFVIPLICSAALLSFAHGANDVANAIGPLAAIIGASSTGDIMAKVSIPFWVMIIGALGISVGLALFGPRLIRTVGEKITKLNPFRAFCVALAAAVTVIIASALGLPVSSTHVAVGGVFGVGFLREMVASYRKKKLLHARWDQLLNEDETKPTETAVGVKKEIKRLEKELKKTGRRQLVRRKHLNTIVAAWLITVPLAAILAGALFVVMNGIRLAYVG